jgi:hypothetical protein
MRLTRINLQARVEFKKRAKGEMEIPSLDVSCSGIDSKILGGGRDL